MRRSSILLMIGLLVLGLCGCGFPEQLPSTQTSQTTQMTQPSTSEHIHSLISGQVVRPFSCSTDELSVGLCSCGEYLQLATQKAPGSHSFRENVCQDCGAVLGTDLEFKWNEDTQSYSVIGMGRCKASYLVIPASFEGKPVTAIGPAAFFGQKELVTVELQEGIQTIGHAAFSDTLALQRVYLPESVEKIDTLAFSECWSLREIYLPAGVRELGSNALLSHGSMEKIFAALDSPYFSALDGVLYNKDITILLSYPSAKKGTAYAVPETVKQIADHAFERNLYLLDLTLPEGLEEIGQRSFYLCKWLEAVTIPGTVQVMDSEAFAFCAEIKTLVLQEGVTHLARSAFHGSTALETVYLPASLAAVPDYAFTNSPKLHKVIYGGTMEQWEALEKNPGWDANTAITTVECSDGTLDLTENSEEV